MLEIGKLYEYCGPPSTRVLYSTHPTSEEFHYKNVQPGELFVAIEQTICRWWKVLDSSGNVGWLTVYEEQWRALCRE